ncbi:hypothetical protein ScFU53_16370 [Streptococcus canis]|nr:hypothetical protein ScFU53_16370 [Streptococcus canis]
MVKFDKEVSQKILKQRKPYDKKVFWLITVKGKPNKGAIKKTINCLIRLVTTIGRRP